MMKCFLDLFTTGARVMVRIRVAALTLLVTALAFQPLKAQSLIIVALITGGPGEAFELTLALDDRGQDPAAICAFSVDVTTTDVVPGAYEATKAVRLNRGNPVFRMTVPMADFSASGSGALRLSFENVERRGPCDVPLLGSRLVNPATGDTNWAPTFEKVRADMANYRGPGE